MKLQLPTLDEGYASVRWEDADQVLLEVRDEPLRDGGLVRCDADSGACEIAILFDGPHLVAD